MRAAGSTWPPLATVSSASSNKADFRISYAFNFCVLIASSNADITFDQNQLGVERRAAAVRRLPPGHHRITAGNSNKTRTRRAVTILLELARLFPQSRSSLLQPVHCNTRLHRLSVSGPTLQLAKYQGLDVGVRTESNGL